ncbi:MAG TPA: hypothetical protein VLD38_07545 [Nitrosopumilaceae archaeon]|nr:hypothetical protein [Nitrosopumilaceae archaeon]
MLKFATICFLFALIIPLVIPAHAEVISFKTDKSSYFAGEKIIFSGIVQSKDVAADAIITIVINDPNGKFVLVTQVKPDHAGSFGAIIVDNSKFQTSGTYHATAYTSTEDQGLSTSFNLETDSKVTLSPPSVIKRHEITVGGHSMFLNIQSSSTIGSVVFDEENKKISFQVTGSTGTTGTAIIPVSQVLKGPYVVTFDGNFWQDFEIYEDKTSGDTLMKIHYPHSTHEITITGTAVVPEFSSFASLVLLISVVSLVFLGFGSRKNNLSFLQEPRT